VRFGKGGELGEVRVPVGRFGRLGELGEPVSSWKRRLGGTWCLCLCGIYGGVGSSTGTYMYWCQESRKATHFVRSEKSLDKIRL
jgi:hypothetical protein